LAASLWAVIGQDEASRGDLGLAAARPGGDGTPAPAAAEGGDDLATPVTQVPDLPRLATPSLPTLATPSSDREELFRLAVDLATVEAGSSAVAYARAAYFLGQLYETGDGVPMNASLASAWYGRSAADGAAGAVPALSVPAADAPPEAPQLLSASRLEDDALELVWTTRTEGPDLRFRVEVMTQDGALVHVEEVQVSALRLEAREDELYWRVSTLLGDRVAPSDLQRIPRSLRRAASAPAEPAAGQE
jgi:hypothetical protein